LVCTRNVPETAAFYRDVLGLPQQSADKYSVVFRTGGVDLRVSLVPDFVTNGHTVMGFRVSDIMAAVQALREKGIVFHRPEGLTLDEAGIWTLPGGGGQVAWLRDPEGNLLSITTV
jgi:catechol 2,3-dioxygenase-like lactoylglutathione lyase family enzyme